MLLDQPVYVEARQQAPQLSGGVLHLPCGAANQDVGLSNCHACQICRREDILQAHQLLCQLLSVLS